MVYFVENPLQMDDSEGYPQCEETPIWVNIFTALADVLVIFKNSIATVFGEPESYIPRMQEATNTQVVAKFEATIAPPG